MNWNASEVLLDERMPRIWKILPYELVKDVEIMGKTVCTFLLCSGCAKAIASEVL
jgi:hypothetical protein